MIEEKSLEELIEMAIEAREHSHAPFSNFRVGAVVVTTEGEIFTGCNVESASYGLTVCAERVAIWKAVSEGRKEFKRVIVVADTEELTPPCGVCRQIIWEFCHDASVTLANLKGKSETLTMNDLLPRAFDSKFLHKIGNATVRDK